MNERTAVITGATSGIGHGIAKGLASKKFQLVLLARDSKKGEAVVENLKALTNNPSIFFYKVDLGSQKQIRHTGREIRERFPRIDVLINNAGVWTSRCELTEEGIEKQFAINHLAYFLLTHLLYPSIAKSDSGRIINIGSDSHQYGKINFNDYNLQNSYHGL